jgi:hypothetical protein
VALNTSKASAATNAAANAIAALLNSGTINIYTGTQPAAGGALSGNTLLVTLTFGSTAFGAAVNGVVTANAITSGTAGNTGTATWFRCLKSDGTTIVMDGTVGVSGANLNIGSTSISSGAVISCSSFTYTDEPTVSGL